MGIVSDSLQNLTSVQLWNKNRVTSHDFYFTQQKVDNSQLSLNSVSCDRSFSGREQKTTSSFPALTAETVKHLPPERGRGVKRLGLEVRWCLAVKSGERTGCFREVLSLVSGELTGEFFVRSKVAIVSMVSETLSEIVSKMFRFGIFGRPMLIDWGSVGCLVRGVLDVALSVRC